MRRFTITIVALLSIAASAFGQAGVSSMTSSALRSGLRLNYKEIRIEELVNYHRHRIPLPEWDQRIALDTRIGRVADGKLAFQIGLATHRDIVEEFRMPLNLVLVIDESGSMGGDRIKKVRQSLLALVDKLAPRDRIAIVTYSSEADVCLESTRVGERETVKKAIRGLEPDGSTNLHAGLMLGYDVALKNFENGRANRVILLTDGIANRGEINEEKIAAASKTYNDMGIGLSTIGLGTNFNRSLLRELAEAGKGAIHFVADAKDIRKVFVDEFDSLLSPAAADVSLEISVDEGCKLPKIFGYETQRSDNRIRIGLENMSYGATQVVIGTIGSKKQTNNLRVRLTWSDSITGSENSVEKTIEVADANKADQVLSKNYTIAKVATAIRKSARLSHDGSYVKATKKLDSAIEFARRRFKSGCDPDVERVCQIAKRQRQRLNEFCKTGLSKQ